MRGILMAAILVAGALAGCASKTEPIVPDAVAEPDWAVRAIFAGADPETTSYVPDHDHADPAIHKGLSTPNFRVLGHDALDSPYYGGTAGTAFCGEVSAAGERQLAVVHSFGTDVALQVIDVTDHTKPVLISELVLPYVFTYDVSIFPDGKYAVIAGNPDLASDTVAGTVPFAATVRNACGEKPAESNVDYIPYGYSAILVDLSEPANPTVADFYQYPAGRNVHSISTAQVDGTRFVLTSGLGAVPCTVPGIPGNPAPNPIPCQPVPRYGNLLSHFDFLTVEETPIGARLQMYMLYTPTDQAHLDPSLIYLANGHTDGTIQKHPVTDQTLAYLADWDGGLHIVRLDGIGQISPVATWGAAPGDDMTQMRGNIHSAVPLPDLWDGRHYTLTGQEVVGRPGGRPTGQIVILDTTTPNQPLPVARWTLPVDIQWPPSQGLLFSTHYPILVDETLYVAMYHGGVWAADASKKNWPDLPSVGVFIPDADPVGDVRAKSHAPEVLQVMDLGNGALLVFDANSGSYTVSFEKNDPRVTPAKPWADNAWIG